MSSAAGNRGSAENAGAPHRFPAWRSIALARLVIRSYHQSGYRTLASGRLATPRQKALRRAAPRRVYRLTPARSRVPSAFPPPSGGGSGREPRLHQNLRLPDERARQRGGRGAAARPRLPHRGRRGRVRHPAAQHLQRARPRRAEGHREGGAAGAAQAPRARGSSSASSAAWRRTAAPRLLDQLPDLDLIVGTQKFHHVPDYLDNLRAAREAGAARGRHDRRRRRGGGIAEHHPRPRARRSGR